MLLRYGWVLPLVLFAQSFTMTAQTIAWKVTDVTHAGNLNPVNLTVQEKSTDNDVQSELIKIDAPAATFVNVNVSPGAGLAGNWLLYAPVASNANCATGRIAYNSYPATFSAVTPIYMCVSNKSNTSLRRGYYDATITFTPLSGSALVVPLLLTVVPNGYLQLSSCLPDPNNPSNNCAFGGDLNGKIFTYNVNNGVADPQKSAYAFVFAPDLVKDPNGDSTIRTGVPLNFTKDDGLGNPVPWVTVSVLDPAKLTTQSPPASSSLFRIGIDANQLPPGKASVAGRVRINSSGTYQGESTIFVNVNVTLPPPPPTPTLSLATTSLSFSYPNGSVSQTLSPQSSGAPISYTAVATSNDGTGWLSVNPTNGDTQTPLTVSANVTPSRTAGSYTGNIAITPTSVSGSTINVSVTLQVSATAFRLGGAVSDASGACSSGVTMALSGGGTANVLTANTGTYSFSGLSPAQYVVTPSKSGCTFSPASQTVNLTADGLNINFQGTQASLTLLFPLNGASGIATSSSLSWSALTGATSYDVYFGTGNPPFAGNVSGNSWPISGASPNVTYTWRVVAKNGTATLRSSDSWSFTTAGGSPPPPTSGLYFIPVTPCHLVDTRGSSLITGTFGAPIMGDLETRTYYPASGNCQGISLSAKAYSFTVTVRPTSTLDYLTIWPAGSPKPDASTLNAFQGGTVSNAAIVPAGNNGGVSVFVTHQSHLQLDINGYFDSVPSGGATAFYAVTPCRIADTRNPNGTFGGPRMAAGTTRDFPVASSQCLSSQANAGAYSLNLTVVPTEALDYVVAWPAKTPQPPSVITLGSPSKAVVADASIVQASSGAISIYASNQTDVLFDVNGYFGAPQGPGALLFHPVTPCRVVNTRDPTIRPLGGPIMEGDRQRTFPVSTSSCGIPAGVEAYSLNVTVVPTSVLAFLTLGPTGKERPFVSTLNDFNGIILANAAIVPAGQNGSIDVYVTHQSHVILDINGYFSAQ